LHKLTLYEFNLLDSLNDKMEAVNQLGAFLDNYIDDKERCNLYAIDMFFVEVVYNPKQNKIEELRAFKYGHKLDRYSNLSI